VQATCDFVARLMLCAICGETGQVKNRQLVTAATRRQMFRALAAGAAAVPFIVGTRNSASAGFPCATSRCCFLKDTTISTRLGSRPVQELQIGNEIETLAGAKSIKWIGHRKYTKDHDGPWQTDIMPIRVARFAIDHQTPQRDLYLSPAHCLFIDGVLIPVMYLVNETSIAPCMPPDMTSIEYYHLELDTHQVVYAEGTAVESYFDDGSNRETFSNFVEYERLYGSKRQSRMIPFAPILAYRGGRQEVKGLLRSVISKVVDVRDPIQIVHDRLAERAVELYLPHGTGV
jgi:hypothetical protein